MEFFQELFLTGVVALFFSFVVAKLLSIAMAADGVGADLGSKSREIVDEVVAEEVLDRGLKVEDSKSKKRVQFVVEQAVEKVEVADDTATGEIEVVEESSGGLSELSVKSSEVGFRVDEAVPETIRGNVETGLDGLVVEERSENAEAEAEADGQVCGVSEVVGLSVKSSEVGFGVEEAVPATVSESEGDTRGNVETERDESCGLKEETLSNTALDERVRNDEMVSDDVVIAQSGEVRVLEDGKHNEGGEERKWLISDGEDDWEGIERSELEKVFATAANYVGSYGGGKDDGLSNLGSDVQMQLYGLHKVAMEGPCNEAQPMALKVSARAKWNAWQRLGNMNPDVAMEQYISLLSDKHPGWNQDDSAGEGKLDSLEATKPGVPEAYISTFLDTESNSNKERKLELKSSTDRGELTGGSNSISMDKE